MKSRLERAQPKRVPDQRKLTQLLVAKIKPGNQRIRVWDTVAPGLVLQVEPSGAKSWYQCYRRSGRPRWHRLGSVGSVDLRDARDAVRHHNATRSTEPLLIPVQIIDITLQKGILGEERHRCVHITGGGGIHSPLK